VSRVDGCDIYSSSVVECTVRAMNTTMNCHDENSFYLKTLRCCDRNAFIVLTALDEGDLACTNP